MALLSIPYLLDMAKQNDAYVYKLLQQRAPTGYNPKHKQEMSKQDLSSYTSACARACSYVCYVVESALTTVMLVLVLMS